MSERMPSFEKPPEQMPAPDALPPVESASRDLSILAEKSALPASVSSISPAELSRLKVEHVDSPDVEVLLRQLESGAVTDFDKDSLELLRGVLRDPDKRSLFARLSYPLVGYRGVGSGLIRTAATTAVGVGTAMLGAREASVRASAAMTEYIKDQIGPFNALVSSVTNKLGGYLHTVRHAEIEVNSVAETAIDSAKDVGRGAIELGRGAVEKGTGIYHWMRGEVAERAVEAATSPNVPEASTAIATTALESILDSTQSSLLGARRIGESLTATAAGLAGNIATIPGAIGGWIIGSGAVGGALGVAREVYHATSYERLRPFVEASDKALTAEGKTEEARATRRAPKQGSEDPRVELLALERKLKEDKDQMSFRLSNKEWLQLAAATHRARRSLLEERTKAPAISMHETLGKALDMQNALVERVVTASAAKAENDRQLAATLLSQFDGSLASDMATAEERFAAMNSVREQLDRYGRAFVGGAVRATGIPLALSAIKMAAGASVRTGARVASAVVNPIGTALSATWSVATAPMRLFRKST